MVCVGFLASLAWATPVAAAKIEAPDLTCEACLLIDMSTGDPLFRRAASQPFPNASTTKMVTALVVSSKTSPRDLVRVSAAAASVGGGGLDLSEGDLATVRDLLYIMLLDSSNEAASALAEHVSGDQADFVTLMNRMVRSLGASGTNLVNPHGLDAAGHAATARDLALIGQRVLSTPELARIVASPRATVTVNGSSRTVENRNVLLESYEGAIGVKTGRTLGAGEVLVAAARRGPHALIAVAMRSQDAAADARTLLDAGFSYVRDKAREAAAEAAREAAEPDVVLRERQAVGALVFDPAGATEVVAAEEVTTLLPEGVLAVDVRFTPADELLLPLEVGDEVGTVDVIAAGEVVASVPALAQDAVMIEEQSWAGRALGGILRTAAAVVAGVRA